MDENKKEVARKKIKALDPNGSTNLWHGIQDGIKVFDKSAKNGNVCAMMVLTDGMPNHM
jgi:Mg-chelatase subunit ChlD